jgi:hypothetical protein
MGEFRGSGHGDVSFSNLEARLLNWLLIFEAVIPQLSLIEKL